MSVQARASRQARLAKTFVLPDFLPFTLILLLTSSTLGLHTCYGLSHDPELTLTHVISDGAFSLVHCQFKYNNPSKLTNFGNKI